MLTQDIYNIGKKYNDITKYNIDYKRAPILYYVCALYIIDLLDSEMKMINKMNLSDAAKNVYNKKYAFPDSKLAQRCLDYKALEQHAREWNK